MASLLRGKIFLLVLLLYISHHSHALDCNCDSEDGASTSLHHHHRAQIDRLEQLVNNLSAIVSRLESNHHHPCKTDQLRDTSDFSGQNSCGDGSRYDESSRRLREKDSGIEGFTNDRAREASQSKMASVTKYSPFWSDRFRFVSAVNLDSVATSINVLPFQDPDGVSKYVAVGDDRGRVYVFSRSEDVSVEFHTLSTSPVTAMMSYTSVYKNESVLVTGHSNGAILVHKIWESSITGTDELSSSFHLESGVTLDSIESGEDEGPVTLLEVHHVGRSRYILSANAKGKIKVFKENGELYGSAMPRSRPLAFLRQRLLFLTETGAGSLDLRTMRVRETECEGLNHSFVKNYVFDATERSKAYGLTSSGDLIHVLLLGDIMNFKCRLRSWKKIEIEEPVAVQAIKGYLLIVDKEKVYVYNVSSQHYARSGSPRLAFSAGIEEIKASFVNYQPSDVDNLKKNSLSLIASDRGNLIILGLGGGCVGIYHSRLPISRGESSTMLWTSPVLFFILFLFGAWHFFAKKKEALTSWGPDDPFTTSASVTGGAQMGSGSGSGDRSFTDLSSRSTDAMDLRGNGLRGASRRYASPTRYPPVGGGGTNTFGPTPVDSSSRPSLDPNFRTTSELKYRGSNLESSGFGTRRDNMYANNQVLDDNN